MKVTMKSTILFGAISKMSLYLLVFLFPLWFLPFTQDALEYQKQAFLVVLVFVGMMAWLASILKGKEIMVRQSWLYIPVAMLILLVGGATLFSIWPYASFWGFPLDVAESFISLIAFALLYVLIVHTVEDVKRLFRLLFFVLASGAIAGVFALLQLKEIYLFPFEFSRTPAFTSLGTPNTVALVSAVLLPLTLTMVFVCQGLLRLLLGFFMVVLAVVVALMNFSTAWIALMIGMGALVVFGMVGMRKGLNLGWISLPTALFVVALFFFFFRVGIGMVSLPLEVLPNQQAAFEIARKAVAEQPFLGSGPGTFGFDYAKFHSPLLNQTMFWGTRFASGASEVLDWLATKGLLGVFFLLGLMATAIFFGAKNLLNPRHEDSFEWTMTLGVFASFLALGAAQFLYPANIALWFLFWLLLAGLTIGTSRYRKKISLVPSSVTALAVSLTFLLLLIFGSGFLFLGGQKYAGEIFYLAGVKASRQGDLQGAIAKTHTAGKLNPSVDLYWRELAQLHLVRINQVANNQKIPAELRRQQVQDEINQAVGATRRAVTLSPRNVANWNVQGFVYRNLIGLSEAENFAIEGYEKAIELEPASPFSRTELGRVYILQAQRLAGLLRNGTSQSSTQENLESQRLEVLVKALEKLTQAIELKRDYAPAHYLIAVVYDQQGKSDQAIAKLQEAKRISPDDVGLVFQLGMVHWQKNKLAEAQLEFERARDLNPRHSNARYMLGLVYDKKGDKEKARQEFSAVSVLNPENEEVQKILANLEEGRAAMEGIVPGQPPIQETPPEIREEQE